MDLNHGPLPYQEWALIGSGMIRLVSVVVRVSVVGLTSAGVAVIAAVLSGSCILLTVRVAFPDPPLAAAGIALRHPDADDIPWITAACSDRELSRYIPGIPYPYSQSDARAFIEHVGEDWAEGTGAAFVIAEIATGDGWGTIGLRLYPADAALAEVGYWLRREARGQGAATTAVRLVAAWAFELGIRRLNLITAPENAASQRVAERAGFTREGLLRAWLPTSAGRRDSVMYSLLPDDPPAKPQPSDP